MYIFNLKGLKDDIVAGPLTEREQREYLLIYVFVMNALIIATTAYVANQWEVWLNVVSVVVAVAGLLYVYHQNGGDDGERFLEKFFALGFVTSLRFGICALAFVFVYMFFAELLGLPNVGIEEATPFDVFLFNALGLVYYWYLGKHIAEVRGKINADEKVGEVLKMSKD